MLARSVRVVILWLTLLSLAVVPGLARIPLPDPDPENSAGMDSIANSAWLVETIESANDVGQHVSIAIHSSNSPYISYYDATNQDLRVAHYVGSGGNCGENNAWSCEVVDDGGGHDVGKYSSIAINPITGHPAIAYQDTTDGALKYAWRLCYPTCHWITETVDLRPTLNQCSRGLDTSLAFVPSDPAIPVISHYCAGLLGYGDLRVAIADSGGDGNCGVGDAAGDWQCDIIDSGTGVGRYTSVKALGSVTILLSISYYDGDNGDLKLAEHWGFPPTGLDGEAVPTGNCGPGNTWNCDTIDSGGDVGRYTSLGRNDQGDVDRIAYYDATNRTLKYAEQVGSGGNCGSSGSWQCDTIDTMGSVSPMGIALGQFDGYSIIAYESFPDDYSPGTLKVARPATALGLLYGNCGPADPLFYSWQCDTIDQGGGAGHAEEAIYTALAVHPNGLVTIAYQEDEDYLEGNLKVAYQRVQVFLPLVARED